MIDYNKLKKAIEMGDSYCRNNDLTREFIITLNRDSTQYPFSFKFENIENTYLCIDDLLEKLEELTEPKYKIGDKWWFLDGPSLEAQPKPRFIVITEENKNYYREDDEWYPSKEALIDAHIEYWEELRRQCIQDKILKELNEYEHDKKLAEKCGLTTQEICTQDSDFMVSALNDKGKWCPVHLNEYELGPKRHEKCVLSAQEGCAHESDGTVYAIERAPEHTRIELKCKKCGGKF